MSRTAVVAEADILERHGAVMIDTGDHQTPSACGKGIRYRGWDFRSFHALMADESELLDLQQKISRKCGVDIRDDDVIVIDGQNLHIPPMLFLKDFLLIEHTQSHLRFDFSAADAICCWAKKHTKPNIEVIEVPYAKDWTGENSGIKQHKWDWTYTSDYNCTITRNGTNTADPTSIIVADGQIEDNSIFLNPSDLSPLAHLSDPILHESSPGGIDLELLRAKDDILFFDDFILYQDDLQDCGECQYSVKIRVMPTCWFTLSRFFLRIDGSRILMKETRIFHNFNSNRIYLEISVRQGQESDYLMPVSTVTPASSLQIPGMPSPHSTRPNLPQTGHPMAPPPPGATGRPLSLTGGQLRDANFMSRVLPIHPFRTVQSQRKEVEDGRTEEIEEIVVLKPQLDYFIQI